MTLTPEHRRALRRIATRRDTLSADEAAMVRAAADSGGSLREIAAELRRSHQHVKRLLAATGDGSGTTGTGRSEAEQQPEQP